jgi:choline-glycine betaine transporter
MFSFAFYNMKTDFSLGASLAPLFGKNLSRSPIGAVIDGLCLFALVAGMAASLATGTLTLSGGLEYLFGIKSSPWVWSVVTLTVVMAFVLSATTGLQKGISILAGINLWIFAGLATFVALSSPLRNILGLAGEALGDHVLHFLATATTLRFVPQDPWVSQWSFFYWAVWLAWTPITAVFLGRIGYGYRVREFMVVNFMIPSLFACVWMGLFGGVALQMELTQKLNLVKSLESSGPEGIIYQLFAHLPGGEWVIPVFLFAVFIAYVSGADANTAAMAGMCSHGICPKQTEPSKRLKYIWGVLVGVVSLAMLQAAGVDGIKMLSNLGGLPALVYQAFVLLALGVVLIKFQKLDVYSQQNQSQSRGSKTHVPQSAIAGQMTDMPTLALEDL